MKKHLFFGLLLTMLVLAFNITIIACSGDSGETYAPLIIRGTANGRPTELEITTNRKVERNVLTPASGDRFTLCFTDVSPAEVISQGSLQVSGPGGMYLTFQPTGGAEPFHASFSTGTIESLSVTLPGGGTLTFTPGPASGGSTITGGGSGGNGGGYYGGPPPTGNETALTGTLMPLSVDASDPSNPEIVATLMMGHNVTDGTITFKWTVDGLEISSTTATGAPGYIYGRFALDDTYLDKEVNVTVTHDTQTGSIEPSEGITLYKVDIKLVDEKPGNDAVPSLFYRKAGESITITVTLSGQTVTLERDGNTIDGSFLGLPQAPSQFNGTYLIDKDHATAGIIEIIATFVDV